MKKFSQKQVLSTGDIPPSIPAFNIADLAHAVDTFRPSRYSSYELPQDLPVYDRFSGKLKRFVKRGDRKVRVVSAPPLMNHCIEKEPLVTPSYTMSGSIHPVMNNCAAAQTPERMQKPRVVSGPPVPPKDSRYGMGMNGKKSLEASALQKSSKHIWETRLNNVTRLSPLYQLPEMENMGSNVERSRLSANIPIPRRRKMAVAAPTNNITSEGLFSNEDEAWCYRDLY
ncbi:hypothetical protein KGF57_000525 [Candida theae]|uniref:Uncharacterized protein n=1 Tax=Candida theae TaxID=1198502 RepID=A0AAD5BIV3_9ASCO|nr:uncharacterized protein KGF57_000525 [Candida theae]KAI5967096.1 hypothetical protein KGF57_000525 [Candida theae]